MMNRILRTAGIALAALCLAAPQLSAQEATPGTAPER